MAYTNSFDISGQTGKVGVARYGGDITFQQLFTGAPQYYAGSIVQVQEVLTIYTEVVRPELVDVDNGWFVQKKYIGTYQLQDRNFNYPHGEGDDGFLVDTIQKIKRYSWYTITANPDVPIALSEGFVVNDCNYYTVPEVYLFPGTNEPVPGFRLREPGTDKPILRGYSSLTKSDLADTTFYNLINGVGLSLNQGVEGVRIDYEAAIINDIYTLNQPFPISTCELGQPIDCQEQFSAFILRGQPNRFTSLADCQVVYPPWSGQGAERGCNTLTWECPNGVESFDYYEGYYYQG